MKNVLILLSFVLGFAAGSFYSNIQNKELEELKKSCDSKITNQSNEIKLSSRFKTQLDESNNLLMQCNSALDLDNKFENERCVCMPWGNSEYDDSPKTKKDICEVPDKSKSVIYSWEAKNGN